MKLYLDKRDFTLIGIAAGVQAAAGMALWAFVPTPIAVALVSALAVALVLAVGHYAFRKREVEEHLIRSRVHNYMQVEALFNLHAMLGLDQPLPPMRSYAISPDAAVHLLTEVQRTGARHIVECGSGASTLILARWLQKHGGGHVWAVDQSPEYAEHTRALLREHGVSEFATVLAAPLRPVEALGRCTRWYDPEVLTELPRPIDLLFVDGPTTHHDPMARLPTVPLLREHLGPHTVILADDTGRRADHECVTRWLELLPGYERLDLPAESGLAVLRPSSRS